MHLLLHYLNVYRGILTRSHACSTMAVLWAYTKLIAKAHWSARLRKNTSLPHTLVLFGKRIFFPSYVFLLYQFEEIFVLDSYRSQTRGNKSLIIDGGSHVGLSVLYFLTAYPEANIIAFEPDPNAFQLLQRFQEQNHLSQVQLVNAALAATAGTIPFLTHAAPGRLDAGTFNAGTATVQITVPAETLSRYISQPVALLKLDIEGAEVGVLEELAGSGKLALVQEVVLEFHTAINGSPAPLLQLMQHQGFEVSSADSAALYDTATDFILRFSRRR